VNILIVGAGRAGSALAKSLRAAGASVRLRPLRRGIPARGFQADLVLLAVRDSAIAPFAKQLARHAAIPPHAVVLHLAGGVPVEALAPLRDQVASIGAAHPLISFASPKCRPSFRGALLSLRGDPRALLVGRRLARLLGARAVDGTQVDAATYHAAAALLANGAVALADWADELLRRAGMPPPASAPGLAALLRSVAQNIEIIGISGALTGPVARGDADTVRTHLAVLSQEPELLELYRLLARRQVAIVSRGSSKPAAAQAELGALLGIPPKRQSQRKVPPSPKRPGRVK
jgi:predicted short-subunit dehydrogenase-like oxidoreductase (DUF2520 family)